MGALRSALAGPALSFRGLFSRPFWLIYLIGFNHEWSSCCLPDSGAGMLVVGPSGQRAGLIAIIADGQHPLRPGAKRQKRMAWPNLYNDSPSTATDHCCIRAVALLARHGGGQFNALPASDGDHCPARFPGFMA